MSHVNPIESAIMEDDEDITMQTDFERVAVSLGERKTTGLLERRRPAFLSSSVAPEGLVVQQFASLRGDESEPVVQLVERPLSELYDDFLQEHDWLLASEEPHILRMDSDHPKNFDRMEPQDFMTCIAKEMDSDEERWAALRPQLTGEPTRDKTIIEQSRIAHTCTWYDLFAPTTQLLRSVLTLLRVHPLTREDIISGDVTREKAELFESSYLLVVLTERSYVPQTNHLHHSRTFVIMFLDFVLSVHADPSDSLPLVAFRLCHLSDVHRLFETSDWIMYAFLDAMTDAMFDKVENVNSSVDALDRLVLIMSASEASDLLRRIATTRRLLVGLRTNLVTKKDMLLSLISLSKEPGSFCATLTRSYLRDIRDHVTHMMVTLESSYETLNYLNSNYLARLSIEVSEASNLMNAVMKKFGAMATLLLPLTLIAGMFGMNVKVPGEGGDDLSWFFGISGVFVFLTILSFVFFRTKQWL